MRVLLLVMGLAAFPQISQAAYTIKEGKLVSMNELATLSVQEHYSLAKEALEAGNYAELVKQCRIVIKNFPSTPFALDSYYYLGIAYFELQEFDLSSEHFSLYLKKQTTPKFFEKAIEYKFLIAEQFRLGARRRLLGRESLPKWLPARRAAIELYDEVISALPQHDLAVKSLFSKADVLFEEEEFKTSIETYQILLRRFPRHPLACDSYVQIIKVYRVQGEEEYADPDYLDLAEITYRKFQQDFMGHPKLQEAERVLGEMREVYARELYTIAQFYERTKKKDAAVIYYSKILVKYPHTETSQRSEERLGQLRKGGQEEPSKLPSPDAKGVIVEADCIPQDNVQ